MADNSAYFEFGTNIDQVVSQVEAGLKSIISSIDSVGAKAGKGGAAGLNANQFLGGINTAFGEMTEGSLQALKNITDQFKKAAAQGKTTVNGQNLTQAIRTLLTDVNGFADDLVKSLTSSLPKEVGTGDLTKIIDSGFTEFRQALRQAIEAEFASIKQIGKGSGLKATAFGQPTSGAVQSVEAATQLTPAFTAQQQAMEDARLAVIAFEDATKGATALTVNQRSLLRQSARGQTGNGRFGPFAFQGTNGQAGYVSPSTGRAVVLSSASQGNALTQLTSAQAAAIQTGTTHAQQWSAATQQAATNTQAAAQATQQATTAAQAAAQAWDAARDAARKLAAGIRDGSAQQISGGFYTQDGKVFRTQTRSVNGQTQTGAFEVNDPLQLTQLRSQLLQRSTQAVKNQSIAPEEKTSYDEFLQGFFGAGGRKRTGGASPIDTTNPLAGFAETAGIVAKYELQGRAIQSLSAQVHDAVTSYFALDEAVRQYNNVVGDSNAATSTYVSNLENLSNAAGIGVVQALQNATRGVAAFSTAADSAAQKNTIGTQFASETAKYSVVTGQTAQDSASQLIAGGQAFGLDTSEASIGRIRNAIANAKESFGSDSSAVAQAMAELGATGKQAGFNLEEFAQVLGKIQAGTGDSGGTLTSNVGRLLDQFTSGTNKQALAGVGVNVTGSVKDEILSLAAVYPKLNSAQQTFITAQLGGARAMRDLIPLLGDSKSLQDAFSKALHDGNAGDREYAATIGSLAGQVKKMSQEFKSLGVDLARTGILSPLLLIAKAIETIVEFADKAVQSFDNLASPFHVAGQGANQLVTGILAVVAAYGVLRAARTRLGALDEGSTSTGRGITGIVANRVGHRRIVTGRDLNTGERLSAGEAQAQRDAHGVKHGLNPLARASQQSATQIQTATTKRVESENQVIGVEARLIAILNDRIAIEEAAASGKVNLVNTSRIGRTGAATAAEEELVGPYGGPIGPNRPNGQFLSRGARFRNFLRPGGGGGLSGFTGGAGGLLNAGLIAAVGYGAIRSTLAGTDAQLKAQRGAENALDQGGVSGGADDLRKAASNLRTAASDSAKASSGLRGIATSIIGGTLGSDKSTRADDRQQADRLTKLADTIDSINKGAANTTDYLTSLVSFKNLDQLNTSITNLQNTGASGTDVFLALDKALGETVKSAAGVATQLSGVQQKILVAGISTATANEVTRIHSEVSNSGGLNPAGLGGVGLGGQKLEDFVRHKFASGTNDRLGANVAGVVQSYFSENPNFNPAKDNAKQLLGLIKQSLETDPAFAGLKGDQKKAADAFINDLAVNAVTTLKTNAKGVFGGASAVAPEDFGKQIDQILATSQQYASEAQVAFTNGATSYAGLPLNDKQQAAYNKADAATASAKASVDNAKKNLDAVGARLNKNGSSANQKAFQQATDRYNAAQADYANKQKAEADLNSKFSAQNAFQLGGDSPELGAAKIKLAADQDALDKAKKYKGADAQGKLDAAQKQVDADTAAVLTSKLAQYQQEAQNASQNENIEDKVAQESDELAGIQKQLSEKMSDWNRKILQARAKALGQQKDTDALAAANAVADAAVQTGNTLASAQQAASDAAKVFQQLDDREKNNATKSEAWGNAKKDAQDKYLAALQAGVEATNQEALANIDPRNTVAYQNQILANLRATLAATTDPAARAQLQQQINAELNTIAEANVAQANAALEASSFPGDPLQDAANKVTEAKNNLSKDLFLSTQWLQDYKAYKQAVIDNANAIANANLTAAELTQDLTDPVQNAKNEVKKAQNKLDIDKFFGAPKSVTDADKVALQQSVSNEEQASFTQRLGFIQTDFQLYRITLPQYIQKLKDLRASIKGNTIQAINDRNQIDQDLLAAYQQGSGQFNIGDIKLPTLYQARRQGLLAGQITTKDLANAGQKAINDGTNFRNVFQPLVDQLGQIQTRGAVLQLTNLQTAINALGFGPTTNSPSTGGSTTNHIQINGADFAKVVAYLGQALGVTATSTSTPISTRKV